MKKLIFAISLALCVLLFTGGVLAAETVYLDGTGATEGAYKTLAEAAAAVDDGGTIIVCGDTATPTTAGNWQQLPEKDITIKGSKKDVVLSLGRAIMMHGNLTIDDITIKNAAGNGIDILYAFGFDLTVGKGVTSVQNASTKRYFLICAGNNTAAGGALNGTQIKLYGGTWRQVSGGNYQGTTTGDVSILIDGAAISGGNVYLSNMSSGSSTASVDVTVKSGTASVVKTNGSSTYTGTGFVTLKGGTVSALTNLDAVVDLTDGGGKVTVTKITNGSITDTLCREGYTVSHEGTVYSVPYACVGAEGYDTLAQAAAAVPAGGKVILCEDYTTPSDAMLTLPKALTITGENDATLTLARALKLGGDTVIENIGMSNTASNPYIYCFGHSLVIGEGVTCTPNASKSYIYLVAGSNDTTATDGGYMEVRSGTWRTMVGGAYSAATTGDVTMILDGGTLSHAIQAGNLNSGTNTADTHIFVKSGTVGTAIYQSHFAGTTDITLSGGKIAETRLPTTLDLTAPGSSVTLAKCTEGATLDVLLPDGCTLKKVGNVYSAAEIADAVIVWVDGKLALIGAVESLDHAAVGFTVTLDGVSKTFTTDTAYESITNGDTVYTAASFGTTGYIFGILLTDAPVFNTISYTVIVEDAE